MSVAYMVSGFTCNSLSWEVAKGNSLTQLADKKYVRAYIYMLSYLHMAVNSVV